MPGFYADGEYDLAGFIVGASTASTLIDGRSIAAGDVLIGLPSSGLHTNGYSLARRIVFEHLGLGVDARVDGARTTTVGEALLAPHRSYLHAVLSAGRARAPSRAWRTSRAAASPTTCRACCRRARRPRVDRSSLGRCRRCFSGCSASGDVPDDDMLRTFNMGIGLILVCTPALVDAVIDDLRSRRESPVVIGEITRGDRVVSYS